MKYVKNEIEIMKSLQSENTIRLFEVFEDENFIYIVMEYCEGGTLFNYVLTQKPDQNRCIEIFVQLLRGFKELHEKKILHRDLKPDNIFIKKNSFKIADFGVAKPNNEGSTYAGTPYYMSPEIFQKKKHNYKTDLWSLGVIFYFMLFRNYPFQNKQNLLEDIKQRCTPYFDIKKYTDPKKIILISPQICDLFKQIFIIEQSQRIGFAEIWENKIFQNILKEKETQEGLLIYKFIESQDDFLFEEQKYDESKEQDYQQTFQDQQVFIKILANDISGSNFFSPQNKNTSSNTSTLNKIPSQKYESGQNLGKKNPQFEQEDDLDEMCNINDDEENGIFDQANIMSFQNLKNQQNKGPKINIINTSQRNQGEIQKSIKQDQEEIQDNEDYDDSDINIQQIQQIFAPNPSVILSSKIENSELESLQKFQEFQKLIDLYAFDIGKYSFIGETIDNLTTLKLDQKVQGMLNYALAKTLLFFAFNLKSSLLQKQNIYNQQEFPQFCKSESYSHLIQKIDIDINRWLPNYNLFFFTLEDDNNNEIIKNFVTENINETDFDSQMKIPLRLVLDQIFKSSYKQGKNENDQKQAEIILRASFQLLLCMLVNNIFQHKQLKIRFPLYFQTETQFNVWKLNLWIYTASKIDLLKSIHIIIQKAFGKQKLEFFLNNY